MPLVGSQSVSFHFLGENFGFDGLRVKDLKNWVCYKLYLQTYLFLLPKFPSLSVFMISRRVQVRLAGDDHPDVRVEIDFTGLGARNSEIRCSMNKLQEVGRESRARI